MAFAKITGEGLAYIALLVALLWGCILVQNSMIRDSRRETARLLSDLRKLKKGSVIPVSRPAGFPMATRPVLG